MGKEMEGAAEGHKLLFQAPSQEVAYRLFITLRDGNGIAATANALFFVRRAP